MVALPSMTQTHSIKVTLQIVDADLRALAPGDEEAAMNQDTDPTPALASAAEPATGGAATASEPKLTQWFDALRHAYRSRVVRHRRAGLHVSLSIKELHELVSALKTCLKKQLPIWLPANFTSVRNRAVHNVNELCDSILLASESAVAAASSLGARLHQLNPAEAMPTDPEARTDLCNSLVVDMWAVVRLIGSAMLRLPVVAEMLSTLEPVERAE